MGTSSHYHVESYGHIRRNLKALSFVGFWFSASRLNYCKTPWLACVTTSDDSVPTNSKADIDLSLVSSKTILFAT